MGLLFSVPKPIPAKPRLLLERNAATWNTLAGAELAQGHVRAAEHLAAVAERMRERLSVEAAR